LRRNESRRVVCEYLIGDRVRVKIDGHDRHPPPTLPDHREGPVAAHPAPLPCQRDMISVVSPLSAGGSAVLGDRFDPETF
jgi:hypothetical protein